MKTVILILCLLSQNKLLADWEQTNGIYGGSVYKIFATGGKIFAATGYGTMYFSDDEGQSYIMRTSGIKGVYISSFASINNIVFASSSDSGVYKTTNDGLSWHKSNSGLRNRHVSSLVINGNLLYAGTSDGFFTSSDGGMNWNEPNNNFTSRISDLTITNNVIFASISSSPYPQVFRSSDNGISWDTSLIDSNRTVSLQTIDSKDSEIYTGGFITGIYRSTDFGISWAYVDNPSLITIHSIKIINDKILAATGNGLYSSTNKGVTWNIDSKGIPDINCRSVTVDGQNVYLGIGAENSLSCIYKSTNQGSNWVPSSSNIIAGRIRLLYKINDRIYTSAGYKGLFYTTNHGDTWINANTDLPASAQREIASLGYCETNYLISSDRNYISTNSGQSWNVFGSSSSPHFNNFITKDNILLALKEYPWKSTDSGLTWFPCRNGYNAGNFGIALCNTDKFTYSISVTPASTSSLFRSSDFGNNWNPILQTSSGYRLTCLAATGNHVVMGYTSSDTGVIVSTDYGDSFIQTNNGLTCRNVKVLYALSNKIFAGTTDGIFYKTLNENSWDPINNASFNMYTTCFVSDSLYLYAGTQGNGIWRIPLNEIITSINENVLDKYNFSLSQNYPNPFNPSTVISYSLSANSMVTLKIFDVLGKEIATIVNERQNAGLHSYKLSTANYQLNNGVYFYQLRVKDFSSGQNFIDTKSMVVLK